MNAKHCDTLADARPSIALSPRHNFGIALEQIMCKSVAELEYTQQ
jgi:hypothetical protein